MSPEIKYKKITRRKERTTKHELTPEMTKATERQNQNISDQNRPSPDSGTINYSVYYYQDGITVFPFPLYFLLYVRAGQGLTRLHRLDIDENLVGVVAVWDLNTKP